MKKRGLMLLLVITISILTLFSVFAESNCTDSDEGRDYYNKGSVSFNNTQYQDKCNFEWGETVDDTEPISSVIEYFCDNNDVEYEFYKCPQGCDHGVCINYTKCDDCDEDEEEQGVFEYDLPIRGEFCEPDKILICHQTDSKELAVCIAEPALDLHLNHDDYLGFCVGEKREQQSLKMEPNTDYKLEFKDDYLTNLIIEVNKQKTQSRIILRSREKVPQSVSKPKRPVARYIIIEHPDLEEEEIDKVKFEFKVEREWVENNTGNESSVILKKYNASKWTDVPTLFKRSNSVYYYYESESKGLSIFAISLKEEAETTIPEVVEEEMEEVILVPEEDIIEPEPKISPYTKQIIMISIATIAVTLILGFIVQYFLKKREHTVVEDDVQKRLDMLDYVMKSRNEGASEESIILNLEKKGYSKEMINNCLSTNYKNNK